MSSPENASPVHENRVAIIGAGNVGATTAYALLQSELIREIILIDAEPEKAHGEALDLQHATPLGPPVSVRVGDYADAARCAIVVVTAGAASKPGQSMSRLDLLDKNAPIIRECVGQLVANHFDGILLMTTNPVDVLARIAQEEWGLPPARVMGSGTVLDTARLRQLLGEQLGVEARAVDAFVLGEHGDSEIVAWSGARVAGVGLAEFASDPLDQDEILRRVRNAAPAVVERKGNTSFAIASCVARICQAILRDERAVLPVSARLDGQYGLRNVFLGTPCVLGARGVLRVIALPLSPSEQAALHASADVLEKAYAQQSR